MLAFYLEFLGILNIGRLGEHWICLKANVNSSWLISRIRLIQGLLIRAQRAHFREEGRGAPERVTHARWPCWHGWRGSVGAGAFSGVSSHPATYPRMSAPVCVCARIHAQVCIFLQGQCPYLCLHPHQLCWSLLMSASMSIPISIIPASVPTSVSPCL